jgi:hypothetical protein
MRSTYLLVAAVLASCSVASAANPSTYVPAQPAPYMAQPGPYVTQPAPYVAQPATACGQPCARPPAPCNGWFSGLNLFKHKGHGQGPVCTTPCAASSTPCAAAVRPACGGCERFPRLKAFFGYRDQGACCNDCKGCKPACHSPLYLFTLRDCAYQPSRCGGCGGCGNGGVPGAVNAPYSQSVFPSGQMPGNQPAGVSGGCCRPSLGR